MDLRKLMSYIMSPTHTALLLEMNGFKLYQQIKNVYSKLKVLFVTASKDNYEVLKVFYSRWVLVILMVKI